MVSHLRSSAPEPHGPRVRRTPSWLVEGLDIIEQRRTLLLAVTGGGVALGILLALTVPELVPPVPLVGAAIAFSALLIGLAAAVAADTTDPVVRGPRHVGAAGGELVAVLPTSPDHRSAAALAEAVLEVRQAGQPLFLGLASVGRQVAACAGWTDELGRALASRGISVLRIDLASGPSEPPGLIEVVRDDLKLGQAVSFEPEAKLARLGAGTDQAAAIRELTELEPRLPRDLDVLLVALPAAASRRVVEAVRGLDHVLVVAERDRTTRVELIASLEAIESSGLLPQVALVDDRTAIRAEWGADVPHDDAVGEQQVASDPFPMPDPNPTTDPSPVPDPDPNPDPLPVPNPDPDPLPTPDPLPVPDPEPVPDPFPTPDPEPTPGPGPMPEPVPEPDPRPTPEPGPEPDPEPMPLTGSAPSSTDSTDELPPVQPGAPEVSSTERGDDDLLRTTAQLAVLLEDLDQRRSEDPDEAP